MYIDSHLVKLKLRCFLIDSIYGSTTAAMNIPEPATAYPFTRVSARLRFENTTY